MYHWEHLAQILGTDQQQSPLHWAAAAAAPLQRCEHNVLVRIATKPHCSWLEHARKLFRFFRQFWGGILEHTKR
jgi:dTDP-4-dehydrorhamnose reductase